MILKVLLVVAVIGIVYFIFIKKKPAIKKQNKQDDIVESNEMVACTACGTYAELSETIISSNKYYCCNECVDKK